MQLKLKNMCSSKASAKIHLFGFWEAHYKKRLFLGDPKGCLLLQIAVDLISLA